MHLDFEMSFIFKWITVGDNSTTLEQETDSAWETRPFPLKREGPQEHYLATLSP